MKNTHVFKFGGQSVAHANQDSLIKGRRSFSYMIERLFVLFAITLLTACSGGEEFVPGSKVEYSDKVAGFTGWILFGHLSKNGQG